MKQLGIKFRKLPVAKAHVAMHNVVVYDVESGEEITSVHSVKVNYDVDGAIDVEIHFYVAAVDVIEEKS